MTKTSLTQKSRAQDYSPAFMAEVAFAAVRMDKSVSELAKEFGVDAKEIADWRLQLQNAAMNTFTGESKPAPRVLDNNPYGPNFAHLPLQAQVKLAIRASGEVDRSAGAIVLHIGASEANTGPVEVPLMEDLTAHLASKLNSSDHAGLAGSSSIVIYVSLIKSISDLQAVARRIHHHAEHFIDTSGHPEYVLTPPGIAFHPLDGKTADELLNTASNRAREIQSQVITLRRAG